jgi:hypothetical protein
LVLRAVEQLEQFHHRSEAGSLIDLLRWSLDPDPTNRPASIDAVLDHAFFNVESGQLREDFAIQADPGADCQPQVRSKVRQRRDLNTRGVTPTF